MIDSFEIRVPSVVETEGDFEVEVRALDAQGAILTTDSTTVVQLIPSDPNIVFDGDGDGIYGEVGDDQKTLTNGIAVFPARDTKAGSFTIDVEDTQARTGSRTFAFSFNCLVLPDRRTEPGPEVDTLNARQFFRDRDTVNFVDPDPTGQEDLTPAANDLSEFQNLTVRVVPRFEFIASDIAQGDATSVASLPNSKGSLTADQGTAANQATYNTNEIQGSPVVTFDGDDFYDFANTGKRYLLSPLRDFTVTAGVRLLQSGGTQTIFSQYEEAVDNGKLVLRYANGFEIFAGSDGTFADLSVKTAAQATNVPLYVVFKREGSTFSIEVDGATLASTTEAAGRALLDTANLVGARSSSGAYNANLTDFFPSDLLYLQVEPGSLSLEDSLTNLYTFEDAYKVPADESTSYISTLQSTYSFDALWPHDDLSGQSILRDVSGNGLNGVLNGPLREQSALLTDGGTSLEYGDNQNVEIPGFSLANTTGRTFHFWVSTNEAVDTSPSSVAQYLFDHQTSRLALFWNLGDSSGSAGDVGLFDSSYRSFGVSLPRGGAVTLVSYVFSGTSCELFFNGVSQGSVTCDSQQALSDSATFLGGRFDGSNGASGTFKMDAVMILNAAQVGADILDIYNDGIA